MESGTSAYRSFHLRHRAVDRRLYMNHAFVSDAITESAPLKSQDQPIDRRLHLTGTLRQRMSEYVIEQQLEVDPGTGRLWVTPRIFRVMATEKTLATLHEHIDHLVTIIGTPMNGAARHQGVICLEHIQPLGHPSQDN